MFRLTGTKKFRRYFTPFQFPIFRYHFFPSFKYISPIKIKNFNQRRFTNLPPTQSLFDPISYASCFIFSLLFYKLCSVSGPSVGSSIHYRYLALLDPCVRRKGEGEGQNSFHQIIAKFAGRADRCEPATIGNYQISAAGAMSRTKPTT